MKISVITVSYNCRQSIADTIASVCSQNHDNIEHVIVDGGSTDGTVEVLRDRVRRREGLRVVVVSEKDGGIYDAMNKGISLACGDVIGFLNADDVYNDSSVLTRIARVMDSDVIDACYSDLVYVDVDDLCRVRRRWRSCEYRRGLFATGWVPPHPTFYVRSHILKRYGMFDLRYVLASDYEVMARLMLRHHIRTKYMPDVNVRMRLGGATNKSFSNVLRQNIEIAKAIKLYARDVCLTSFFAHKLSLRVRQYCERSARL